MIGGRRVARSVGAQSTPYAHLNNFHRAPDKQNWAGRAIKWGAVVWFQRDFEQLVWLQWRPFVERDLQRLTGFDEAM